MAGSSTRYSEADRRGRNTNQDVTNIGVAGRRTGLRVEGARRGSDGFENESAFFSPTTTVKKANAIKDISSVRSAPSATRGSGSYQDMDLEASRTPPFAPRSPIADNGSGSAQDVVSTLRRRSEGPKSPIKSGLRRSKSPTKTNLNSPALRVRSSHRKPDSPPKSALRSPSRPVSGTSTGKVARKLDFNRVDLNAGSDVDMDAANDKETSRHLAPADLDDKEGVTMAELQGRDFAALEQPDILPNAQNDDVRYDETYDVPNDELDPPFDEYLNDGEDEPENEVLPIRLGPKSPPARSKRPNNDAAGSDPEPEAAPPEVDADGPSDVDSASPPPVSAKESKARVSSDAAEETQASRKRGRPSRKDATATGKTKGKKDKVAPRPSFSPSKAAATRERSARTASPQREWREPVTHDHDNEREDEDGGVRKSSRLKIAPLAFWRGEKMVFGRGSRRKSIGGTLGLTLPEVKEIIHVDLVEGDQVRRRSRAAGNAGAGGRRSRKRTGRRRRVKAESDGDDNDDDDESDSDAYSTDGQADHGGEAWEESITVEAPVRSFEQPTQLVKKVLAIPSSAYHPKPVVGQGILFQKTLAEEPHFAAGVLDIPAGAGKPVKPSKQNTMFFFLFTGYVQVKIHDVVFRLRKGGQFTVPRGNFYEIQNVGKRDARLFFSQSTDTFANHLLAHPEEQKPVVTPS